MRPLAILLLLCALAPADAAHADVIACTGVFGRDTSHARLVETFGRGNVIYKVVDAGEGFSLPATILFPKDDRRKIEFFWHDTKHRRRPSRIAMSLAPWRTTTPWKLKNGLRLGMTLIQAEQLNGRPFSLTGFGFDGIVTDWRGGALQATMGMCEVLVWFAVDNRIDTSPYPFPGNEGPYLSNDPAMRAAKPTITGIELRYER